jgi:multidrug efflux pump subunit AcrA (membrane-fusion protein)
MNKSMKTVFIIPVLFISFFFLISATGCGSAGKAGVMPAMQNKTGLKPKEHQVVAAETRTVDKFLSVNALVLYDDFEELSFKIDYYNLKAIYVDKDEHVEEGQLLAELDASGLEYQIAARQIDLKRVQLRYDMILSEPGMESADRNTELESLKLDMESINLDISHIKELIEKTQLIAPFSGVITDIRDVQPGAIILAYDRLLTIWKPDSVILLSDILNPYDVSGSLDLSGVVTGMKVVLIHGGRDTRTEIPATITGIINTDPGIQANPNRILSAPPPFRVYVKPDGIYADKLIADNTVTLMINTEKLENAVVLPKSAVRGFGADHMIKVVKGEKIITRRVTTGYEDNEEDIVVITSGLRPGESILLD